MNLSLWLSRSAALTSELDSAEALGTAAETVLALARHRSQLMEMDWMETASRESPDVMLRLTGELPRRECLTLRVLLAARLLREGKTAAGRRIVEAVFRPEPWPLEPAAQSLAWAVILADQPDLLSAWRRRMAGDVVERTMEWLGQGLEDGALARMLEAAESGRERGLARMLITAMWRRDRLPALLFCMDMLIGDHSGEKWEYGQSAQEIRGWLLSCVCRMLLKRGRIREALDLCWKHDARPLVPFSQAARWTKVPEAMRLVLESAPDDCGGLSQWAGVAETLAWATDLATVWPFVQKRAAEDWTQATLFFEEIVDRAVITGEVDPAEKFLALAPEETARPLRARLALSRIRGVRELAAPAMKLLPNRARWRLAAWRKGGREELARLALSDFLSGAARRGALLLSKLRDHDEEPDEAGEGEETETGDTPLDLDVMILDLCGALKKLDVLVPACVKGGEWGHPAALLHGALIRLYQMEGFATAFAVFAKLPEEAREDTLEEWAGAAARCGDMDSLVRMMRDPVSGRPRRREVMRAIGITGDPIEAAAMQRTVARGAGLEEEDEATGAPVGQGMADWPGFGKGDSPAPAAWPAITFSPESILDGQYWRELTLEEIDRRVRAVPKDEAGGRAFAMNVHRWRRGALPYAVRKVLDAAAAAPSPAAAPPDFLENPDAPLRRAVSAVVLLELPSLVRFQVETGRLDLLADLLFGPPSETFSTFNALEETAWRLPDSFYLEHRHGFALCTGFAHWMAAAAAARGLLPDSVTLVETARGLDMELMLFRPASMGGCEGVDPCG